MTGAGMHRSAGGALHGVLRRVMAAAVVAAVVAAGGCGRSDATGEAFSVGDFFEVGSSGNKLAGVTRRPADGGGDDVTLFWYWVSGYVSAEGAAEDLRAFSREGFKRVVINDVELPDLYGTVRNEPLSEGWWQALHAALATAAEEHIEVGITVRPGLGASWPYTAGVGAWSDAAAAAGETGAAAAERHFGSYVGKILRRLTATERQALRFVVAGDLPSSMRRADGAEDTVPAAWRADYMRRVAELCRAEGLKTMSRDARAALVCGADAAADGIVGAVRFVPDGAVDDARTAASAARLCGMRRVAAEVGCTEPKAYVTVPDALKRAADVAYVQGVNFVALSGAVQQASAEFLPGLNTWLFSEMDRNNPWFPHIDMAVDYLWRCNMMLTRGERVTDVAIPFAGEDAARTADIVAEAGYDSDYLPLEALAGAEVSGGAVVVAGHRYAAVVSGRGAGAEAEAVLASLAGRGARVVRTGMSYRDRKSMREALAAAVAPDVAMAAEGAAESDYSALRYTHRTADGREIYFLFNGSSEPLRGRLSLRCEGDPELWNPVDGGRRAVREYSVEGGRTSFEVSMAAGESLFVVTGGSAAGTVASRRVGGYPFEYRWDVSFRSPVAEEFSTVMYDLKDLSTSDDRRIRFFSGRTTYSSLFEVRKPAGCDRVELVMREVGTTAKVWINDRYVGGVWTSPYRLDVTDAVRNGMNSIRIETAGTWANAIVGMMTALRDAGGDMGRAVAADSTSADGWRVPQLRFTVNTYSDRTPLPVSGLTSGVALIYYGR